MFALLATLVAAVTGVAAQTDDSALVAKLLTANSQVTKIMDLPADSQYVFNFMNGSRGTAQGGFAVGAVSTTFPALLTGRGAMVVGVLGPCGANSPHTHPRATEIQIVVQGGPIYAEMAMEDSARVVRNNVSLGEATIFPEGSLHFQQNMACEPTVFIASFDNVDPGTLTIAQNFFSLNQGVVDATLGEIGVSVLDSIKLPENFVLGAQECLDRCNINRSTFNFSASFADYAIFSNSTWTTSSSSGGIRGSTLAAVGTSSNSGSTEIPFEQNPLRHTVIGLGTLSSVLFIAVIGLVGLMFCRRRSARIAPPAGTHFPTEARGYPYDTPYDDAEGLVRSSVDHKEIN